LDVNVVQGFLGWCCWSNILTWLIHWLGHISHHFLDHQKLLMGNLLVLNHWLGCSSRVVTHLHILVLSLGLGNWTFCVNIVFEIQTYFKLIILLLNTRRYINYGVILLSSVLLKCTHLSLIGSASLILILLCSKSCWDHSFALFL